MALNITFEGNGGIIRGRLPILAHWGEFQGTFGFQCPSERLDYRNGYTLDGGVKLIAQGSRNGQIRVASSSGDRAMVARPVFPESLMHEFQFSENLNARVKNGQLDFFVKIVGDLPWRYTPRLRDPEMFWSEEGSTSIASLGLRLSLWLIFHPPLGRPAPIEFEWGTPGVFAGAFETNRRRH